MKYPSIVRGVFLDRPNRFIAKVMIDGILETVHVKNTGRCREILRPGAAVILERAGHPGRKTAYSLVAVYKGDLLINIDSQIPNQVVAEALRQGLLPEFGNPVRIAREVVFGNSRFDLYYENESEKGYIEVKGVTLERDGTALFPDAPTERGTKHLLELIEAAKSGYTAAIFFLIQMKGPIRFQPNTLTDPKFAEALLLAKDSGVKVLAYDSVVSKDGIVMGGPVPLDL
ncbi:MAG TPA: DNA/RNA nuclease SfsA [Bacillota bacterium]